jgi:hypothetical protein
MAWHEEVQQYAKEEILATIVVALDANQDAVLLGVLVGGAICIGAQ